MSSLWTPDGEHPVGERREPENEGPRQAPTGESPPEPPDELDEEALRAQIDEARARVAEVPAQRVVANHAMGLYELAAIHLSFSPPNLEEAALAIDALGCLVEGLGDRMGPDGSMLRDALAQIRLAFVQIKGTVAASPVSDAPAG
ncbi:MAG TPA: hypothetical protein VFP08_10265 [Acidimicrobiales bacterium]|nr:hypothetical protein [Acidimicrobiales bacterium]